MRAVLCVALLCLLQACRAEENHSIEAVIERMSEEEAKTNSTIAAIRNSIVDGVAASKKGVIEVVSHAIDFAQKQVNNLVNEAQADGVAAAECGIDANADLVKIATDLPVELAHCLTNNLHAFDQYNAAIAHDFAAMAAHVVTAIHDSAECWVNVLCQAKVSANLVKDEAKTILDVGKNVVQIEATKINVVANTIKCNVQTQAATLVKVAKEVPNTASCISKKRAEIKSKN